MKYVAVSPHRSNYPDPIRLTRGDAVALGRRDDQHPGWIWVTTNRGEQGWAPEASLDIAGGARGVAREHYKAVELDVVAGQRLRVHRELAGWLWVEDKQGQCGWIPRANTDLE